MNALEALAELVRLKDLKQAIDARWVGPSSEQYRDYYSNRDRAWREARAAVAAASPGTSEETCQVRYDPTRDAYRCFRCEPLRECPACNGVPPSQLSGPILREHIAHRTAETVRAAGDLR